MGKDIDEDLEKIDNKCYQGEPKKFSSHWQVTILKAIDSMKKKLTQAPILGFPDF